MRPAIRDGIVLPTTGLAPRLRAGLDKLKRASEYAGELGLDAWDFAVEIGDLRAEGLDHNDFRWLVCKGYVEHAGEVTALGEAGRSFRPTGRLSFCERTCFVLTGAGLAFLGRASGEATATIARNGHAAPPPIGPAASRPSWDRQRQELCLGRLVVKQFKVPAPNQETILAAFEEEGWPPRIDDPIPPQHDADPKRRLHDTINSLNRCQRHALIRFLGDGSGQGVRWELVVATTNGHEFPAHNGHRG